MATAPPPSDDDLLRRTAAGDEQAFTALYRRYQGMVYRFAMQMSNSAEIAEEVTQEVFLVLMHKPGMFDPSRGRLSSWLYGIARNQVLRQLERRNSQFAVEINQQDDDSVLPLQLVTAFDPIETLSRHQQIDALRDAIQALPPRYREVVVLCELHEMSYLEAAEITGCAVGTIRSRLHRSRALLQRKLAAPRNRNVGKIVQEKS